MHAFFGFPHWLSVNNCLQCRRCLRLEFDPWVGKIPWRRKWQPTLVFLPGKSHGQRSLVGCSPWGRKESGTAEATEHAHTHMFSGGKVRWCSHYRKSHRGFSEKLKKRELKRDFLFSAVIKTSPSSTWGMCIILGRGTKIPHVLQPKNQKLEQSIITNSINTLKIVRIKNIWKKRELPYDPAIPFLDKTLIQKIYAPLCSYQHYSQ